MEVIFLQEILLHILSGISYEGGREGEVGDGLVSWWAGELVNREEGSW